MSEIAQIFTEESCTANREKLFSVELLEPYWGHVWAILGPCLGYFYNIFASRCLKWLKFSLVSLKVGKFGAMDIAELHGDILQPWGAT